VIRSIGITKAFAFLAVVEGHFVHFKSPIETILCKNKAVGRADK
jgi:hypothetical protein